MQAEKEWISPGQAARRLGVGQTRIHKLLHDGRIRFQQTPLGRLVDADSVEEYRIKRDAILARS